LRPTGLGLSYDRHDRRRQEGNVTETPAFVDTAQLLAAARAGDREALDKLIVRYQDRVLARIRLMMGPGARRQAESMDLVQGAFVDLLASLPRLELADENSLLRFIIAVARNNIRDAVRKKRERAFESLSLSVDGRPANTATPSDDIVQKELVHRVAEVFETLRKEHRTVIELRNLEGLSFQEIGARMARTEAAAFRLHARALVHLGSLLKDRDARRG
jgi:RNA polymerase sigma-70 factor (ECF subfamily)